MWFLSNIYNRLEEWFLALLLASMTLVTFANVVARYVFSSGFVWALELTTALFAWLVLFGMSYAVRVNAHIGIDAVVKLFPPLGQRIIGLIAILCCLVYCVILGIGAWRYLDIMYTLGNESEDLPIQQWIIYLILPVGFALLFARFLQVGVKLLIGSQIQMLADEAADALKQFQQDEPQSTSNNSPKEDGR
ncbi:TRAP transporter small permease [Beggiatoa leptomitoformis]|uniref:TRAP transporter small permease protein n=1 Tax=Beggiatoa leptomitoformis TaxID=288004 RepID=A0A2N9YAF0_9GAMM|nr:TRAP transporter small permease [Beggiatoa leptomitoformis]ALG67163.1 TRAP transporter small permease subunit [Beggiatoa leptomitoformis]AUI67435.1 TRAP transporter small permease subunit [Beggiatoa leptomitoformis]